MNLINVNQFRSSVKLYR